MENMLSLGYDTAQEYIMRNCQYNTYHGSFYTVDRKLYHMIKHHGALYYVDEDIDHPDNEDLFILTKNKYFELKPVYLDLIKETNNICPLNKFLNMADIIVAEWSGNE